MEPRLYTIRTEDPEFHSSQLAFSAMGNSESESAIFTPNF